MEYIEQFLRTVQEYVRLIGFFDVLDMAIVAFVVYHIFRFVRRSRSGQVVKAILLLLVGVSVANMLHLQVVSFVLNNAVELGFIALVIIFQPEIRRFLEQMGSGKIKEMFVQETIDDELEYAIRETVEAYTSLSKDKVGALMVFERKTMLDDVLKTGTPLDARVSAELLKNLFWNKAPLHDGAVIVRNGRIVGAGCMLPMSGNVNISRDLGMRHRAGIGISENSDAVVVLVSEETGAISVAVDGSLRRHLSAETLEKFLYNELLPNASDKEQQSGLKGGLKDGLFNLKTLLSRNGVGDENQ